MKDFKVPSISVIMPFYNAANFLEQAIESILKQTFDDFELIIINDASTDNSKNIVNRYLDDQRVVYIENNSRQGVAINLNKGLEVAKADFIARMDGDDISDPERLKIQYEYLKNHPDVSMVGTFIEIINEQGKVIDYRTKPLTNDEIRNDLINYGAITIGSSMFKKSPIEKIGGYRTDLKNAEDIDLLYRLVYSGEQVANIGEYLYQYRYHTLSTSKKSFRNAIIDYKLRKQTIKKFKLHLSFKQYLLIYLQLAAGLMLGARARQKAEAIYKWMVYGQK